MGNYQGYQKYKDSGVEWLGDIPEHWRVKRIKFLVNKIGSGKTPKGGSEVYIDSGIMLIRSQNVYDDGFRLDDVVYIDDEIDNIQANSRVFANDILLNITGASIGRVCLVPTDFQKANVNQHVCIFRPKLKEIFPQYLHLLFCSTQGKEQIFSYENGTSREGLNFQEAGNLTFAIPPLNEQQKIAQFLDYKTKQIDELIKKKETLIEKLDEKRTAVISHAVTKGLDSSVPMKDSCIEWLGEIPKHWKVKRLKNIASCNDESLGENTAPDFEIEYVDISSVDLVSGIRHYENMTFEKAPSRARRKVQDGDTIISTVRTYLKSIAAIKQPPINLIVSTGFAVIRPKININSNYIGYLLQSEGFVGKVVSNSVGVSYPAINSSVLISLPVVEPPINEQQKIAQFLDYKTAQIDKQKAKIKQAIELLKEYRTSLITNAVTGKIDVSQVDIP